MFETTIENHETGEKRVIDQPIMPRTTHANMDDIIKAANAIANKPAGEVLGALKAAFPKPKKSKAKPAPAPQKADESQWLTYYCKAVLRVYGFRHFEGLDLEDLKDMVAGIRVEFMPYEEWKKARGYGKEENTSESVSAD